MPGSHAPRGFTLIELLIVLVVIGILVTMALPSMLSARIASQETSAVATLHHILQAQSQFAISKSADVNANGVGEFGTFGELSGTLAVREAFGGTRFLDPALVSPAFRSVSALGELTRAGYLFRIYLPDATGGGVAELPGGGASPVVDASTCEGVWCVYAWPQRHGATGRRTFFANQSGNILFTDNPAYSGPGAPIPAGAAFTLPGPPSSIEGPAAVNEAARDGNVWRVVNP